MNAVITEGKPVGESILQGRLGLALHHHHCYQI